MHAFLAAADFFVGLYSFVHIFFIVFLVIVFFKLLHSLLHVDVPHLPTDVPFSNTVKRTVSRMPYALGSRREESPRKRQETDPCSPPAPDCASFALSSTLTFLPFAVAALLGAPALLDFAPSPSRPSLA